MILFYLTGIIFIIMGFSFLLMFIMFIYLKLNLFIEWNFLTLNSSVFNMLIYLDLISLVFIFLIFLISSMIMFYCCEYMNHEKNWIRFFFLVFLFIVSMILMIVSPNLISIILGWDGLGLTSYVLVIYYQNYFSFNSGMLTVLMNRVGDVMILFCISIMFITGSWNFMNLYLNKFLLLLLISFVSFTKSAQFPFSSWLPAAMAAPTPVSSLVHSSTLVTAGVYMLIRFKNLIYMNKNILTFILMIGMITMFMAGLSANCEFDFKKIIAFSTLSQLGLMMVIYSMKFYMLSFFHLIIHAMFKSMMFMCSGIVIHMMMNYQDIRFMGNLINFMPMTMIMFMISNFSLCGLPFFSGFYSKDLILEKIFMSNFMIVMLVFLIVSTMFTVMYSFRLMLFLMNKNFYFLSFFKLSDFKLMNFSLLILMFNSIISGYILFWLMFFNIDFIYLMFMEKIMVLLICLISLLLMKMYFLSFFNNLFLYFFGKMFLLNYLNLYYLNLFNLMKKYNYIIDKGLSKYIFEFYFYEVLKKFNYSIMNNNYLVYMMLMMNYMILLFYLI